MEESKLIPDDEQEIDLKALIIHVFRRWRSLLAALLAAAVLGVGISVVQNIGGGYTDPKAMEDKAASYEMERSVYEGSRRYYQQTIAALSKQLDFLSGSILANTDPDDVWAGSVELYVSMGGEFSLDAEKDPADAIVTAYAADIGSCDYLQPLADEMGTELAYIKEMVRVAADHPSNAVNVRVFAPDGSTANRILDGILARTEDLHSEILVLGSHQITALNRRTGAFHELFDVNVDTVGGDERMKLINAIADAQTRLSKLVEPEAPAGQSAMGMVRSGAKYGLIGGIVGSFLLAILYAVLYVLDSHIHSAEDLKNRFGVRVLGEFSSAAPGKRVSRFDAWLDRLDGKTGEDPRQVYDHIAAGIHVFARGKRKILLTGTVDIARIEEVRAELAPLLPEQELTAGGFMNANPGVLRGLNDYDGVVLLEGVGVSKYSEIAVQMECIRAIRLPLLGVVVVS